MNQILDYLFGAASFMPHGYCLLWRPDLVALHAISDALIGLAYISIPLAMMVFLRKRRDLNEDARTVAYLFMAFIVACALTHFTALLTLWIPAYGAQGLVKAATAIISVVTAIAVWPQIPRLLALPSPAELSSANDALKAANQKLDLALTGRTRELDRARERFETALTGSNITVYTQDTDLKYTWIHHPRLGYEVDDVIGSTDREILPEEAADVTVPLKQEVLETGETRSTYLAVESEGEGTLYLDLTVNATHDSAGNVDGLLCTVLDMTEKNLFEVRLASMATQLAEANRRFETALDGSLITVFEQDLDLRYVHIVNPPPGTTADDFLGKTDYEFFSAEDQLALVTPKQEVFENQERTEVEVDIVLNGKQKCYNVRLEPKFDADGEINGVIGTAVDLTHKRNNERQMRLVMRELTHRSKNLLAVIQAMARQTAARTKDKHDFVERFSARLQAMAASHDLLVSHSWFGAGIEELARVHLSQTVDPSSSQVEVRGETLHVSADAAQNLGLALHELTTNAAKYGALSVPHGHLSLTWDKQGDTVRIRWKESGGPKVSEPERKGFGHVLLERSVGPSLEGNVAVKFEEDGLFCEITFPISQLVDLA
ncbi:sensor histidine kinase [Roseibium sp.]|uniref:sensor histidine kinase n=1 Tax=Roseibium sp. TaxID=1936156 RepID=UPI003A974184